MMGGPHPGLEAKRKAREAKEAESALTPRTIQHKSRARVAKKRRSKNGLSST